MRSSYYANNYGEVFQRIIYGFRPINCVELGVLDGYSAIHIGSQLKDNGRGHLHAYDLFEDYPYKHGQQPEVQHVLESFCVQEFVTLHKQDAKTVAQEQEGSSIDFLHVDLSNTGDTVRWVMEQWDPKMRHGGIICFEGGTQERDQIGWMKTYNATPIKPEIETNEIIKDKYIFGTYLPFPGLTMLLKKR